MLGLAFRTLRKRKGGFVATFIALLFGTTIVVACAGLMESGIQAAVAPQRLASAPIVVAGKQTFDLPQNDPSAPRDADEDLDTQRATLTEQVRLDADVLRKVQQVPGVAETIGDVSFPATVLGKQWTGHGWGSAKFTSYAGAAPRAGEVVVDNASGLKLGDQVGVAVRGKVDQYRVAGLVAAPSTAFFSTVDTTRIAPRLDLIGVRPQQGTDVTTLRDTIETALAGQAVVLTGDERGLAEFPETQEKSKDLITLSAVTGGMATMVAMFVVASTMMLSIQQRRRELALLRATGATPRQTGRMVVGETFLVALVAGALAVVPGSLFGEWLFGQLSDHGVVPSVLEFRQTWVSVVSGAGAIFLAALGASWVAGRRAGKTRPIDALTEAAVQRKWVTPIRVITALLCLGGGSALAIVTATAMKGPAAASTAGPSVLLWAIGLAMISPGITRVTAAIVQWPLRAFTGVNGYLAVLNAKSRVVLMAGAITPIMLAIGVTTANIYLQTTMDDVDAKAQAASLRADAVVSSPPSGLPTDLLDRIQHLPGVAGASETVTSQVFVVSPFDGSQDDEGWPALGLTASGAAATTAIVPTAGKFADLTGNTVILPSESAGKLGDTVAVRLGDGAVEKLRVVGIADRLILPARLLAEHTTNGVATSILVRAAGGTSPPQLIDTLRKATAGQALQISDRTAVFAAQNEGRKTGAWVAYLMTGMITAYTSISVANTLVMGTARRRREFGLQRLTGSTRAQVMRMMGIEGLLVAVIGIVLGTIVAALAITPFTLVATDSLLPSGSPWIYLGVIGGAGVLAMVATLIPAWAATRSRPVEAVVDNS